MGKKYKLQGSSGNSGEFHAPNPVRPKRHAKSGERKVPELSRDRYVPSHSQKESDDAQHQSGLAHVGHEKDYDVYQDKQGNTYKYSGKTEAEFKAFLKNPEKLHSEKKQAVKDFEYTRDMAELKALSKTSLERPLSEKEYLRMKELSAKHNINAGKIVGKKVSPEKEFSEKKQVSEREILLWKHRLAHGKVTTNQVMGDNFEPKRLTPEHERKGIDFLRKKYYKESGEPRKDCPFQERETEIIKNFDHFELVDFYGVPNGLGEVNWYEPVYRCVAKDGNYFEYYYSGGKTNITG